MLVFVKNKHGEPLMPCKPRKARLLLKQGKAKVIRTKPFTIQLLYGSSGYKQSITLGVDSGYENIGVSAVTEKEELFSAEVTLLKGMSERLKERAMYRRQRRNRLRYRKPRFDNRRRPEGWLAPSIQHKLDSHIRLVNLIKSFLPVTKVIVEVANFDIHQIKSPEIEGKAYQQGEQYGYYNLREYILHRDNHQCQRCGAKDIPLEVHHIGYWKGDRTNRPGNLSALCIKCHHPKNHEQGGFLWGWEPKLKNFKPETFMSTVRRRLVSELGCEHTYGHITKSRRIELGLEKSHVNDAFVIACGTSQVRATPYTITQVRRNNRSLERFYDARYHDLRTGKPASGQELSSCRRTRNKALSGENLRQYRGHKITKGRRSIRRQRYLYQPSDLVKLDGTTYTVKGTHCKGARVILKETGKSVKVEKLQPYRFMSGMVVA